MSHPIIQCIVGPIGSGKTTYLEDMYSEEDWIRVSVGNIMRSILGDGFFASGDHPNAPLELDRLIGSFCREVFFLSRYLHKPLVFDGFPRVPRQVDMFQEMIEGHHADVTIRALRIDESVQICRLKGRNKGELSLADKGRMVQSRSDFNAVIDRFLLVENNPVAFGLHSMRVVWRESANQDTESGLQGASAVGSSHGGGCGS